VSFREVLEIVRLRWYLAAAVLLVTIAAGWLVAHPQRMYQATSVILLVPPKEPSAPNSLAATTPSVAQTGLMVDAILNDSTSADRLRAAGVFGDFTLAPRNNGTTETPKYTVPAEQLTVTGPDPALAVRSVTALSAVFEQELADLQARAGVRAAYWITAQVLVPPAAAPILGSKIRGLVGVAVLGTMGAVLLPHWFERYARRRARRAAASRPPSERVAAV
jgi:uncharacterized protein involved in exopolysaccharide biosynthesis